MRTRRLVSAALPALVLFSLLSINARAYAGSGDDAFLTTINPQKGALFISVADPIILARTIDLKLVQIYPQMVRTNLTIVWQQSKASSVEVRLRDVSDQVVMVSRSGEYGVGEHEMQTDLSELMPGLYTYQLQAGDEIVEHPLMVIR